MKRKKLWITLGAIVLVLAAAAFYLNHRNRTLSPPGDATLSAGDLTVTVTYSRPSARGRVIFGSGEDGALLPYGKYWRLGANEATEVTFNRDVTFNGEPVKAGTYRVFAFPGPANFEIGLNTQTGKWGAMEPDYSKDILRTRVPVEKLDNKVEQYTISLENADGGINIVFEWSDTRFVVPVR